MDARAALGDLEAVAAKALRKEPAQRYGSVRAQMEEYAAVTHQASAHSDARGLAAGGLLLIASAPLPDDALFQFRFCLNDDGRPLPTVEVGAHVLWQAPAGAPGQHYVGMRFIGLSPDATRRLRLWTEQEGHGF